MKQGFQKIMPIVRLCIVQITTLDMLEIQKSGIRQVSQDLFLYLSRKPSPSPSQLLNKRRKRSSSPVLLELLPVEDPEL